jgi:predicted phosphoadenosine phosphosulfate sulfurtransferase
VALEVCIEAARRVGRLPVDAIMRDDEILLPGTFEYAERTAARPEVNLAWIYSQQASINFFNREDPFWWAFDPILDSSEWVRIPPPFAELRRGYTLSHIVRLEDYPPDPGKETFAVVGIRAAESPRRMMSIHSAGGCITKPQSDGIRKARLIYDWSDGDVWLAYKKFEWDRNRAYDALTRAGVPARRQRIAVPTLNVAGIEGLQVAAVTWPKWFERVAVRLPGVRMAVQFGKDAIVPIRVMGETWEDTFQRVCVKDAPAWIAERAETAAQHVLRGHSAHASSPLPQKTPCRSCPSKVGSWEKMTKLLYSGDPMGQGKIPGIHAIHPSVFRPGAGDWSEEVYVEQEEP